MENADLLAELEDLIRTMPDRATLRHHSNVNLEWFGAARAIIGRWNFRKAEAFGNHVDIFLGTSVPFAKAAFPALMTVLHEARSDLMMKTGGRLAVAVNRKQPFDYYEEVRKVIAGAQSDLFMIDPYMDAEFAARYLPHVRPETAVRLLTSKYIPQLVPSVELFAQQHGLSVSVRKFASHDRYVFVDRKEGYLSSASFKDGGKSAAAMFAQVTDLFSDVQRTYENEWGAASVVREP